MPDTERSSPVRGLSRRDFLKYSSFMAALIGAGPLGVTKVAEAIEAATNFPIVVWSDFQECLGCTVALLQATAPTPAQLILQQISLAYNEAAMAAAGADAEKSFNDAFAQGAYWVIEGSIPEKIPGAIAIGGKNAGDIAKEFYPKAKGVIAIGSCACFGNVQAHVPNPTGAMGVGAYLRGPGGIPDAKVVNLPRCPGHGDDLVATLIYILVMGKLPDLDKAGRPLFLYGQTIHETCERRAHFEAGEFVEHFGDEGSQKRWCFYKVGCKGPVTYAPCAINRWNGRVSWCVHSGPCTGCSEDNFWNDFSPLREPVPNIPIPAIQGVSAENIGLGLAAVTGVGLAAHLVGQTVSGRLFKGGPPETSEDQGTNAEKGGDVR
ncbi:MAG TPA: hydrogenase small subunit [Coriobacteriia bacterium]